MAHSGSFRRAMDSVINSSAAKQLLAELLVVEEEIALLEDKICKIQGGLSAMQQATAKRNKYELETPGTIKLRKCSSPNLIEHTNFNATQKNKVPEVRAMFFINQAMKEEYLNHPFNGQRLIESLHQIHDENGPWRVEENKEVSSRKSGSVMKIPSIKTPPCHPTERENKISSPRLMSNPVDANAGKVMKMFQEPTSLGSGLKGYQNVQPNKLSEKIMRCLIFIFIRLIRTSRAVDLEKTGNMARFATFLGSGSFRNDGSVNVKPNPAKAKEKGQQDPYGIFDIPDSLLRDIGPYKNLVRFVSSSLDPKGLSTSLALLSKLRDLMDTLNQADLRFLSHQEKLAFWINICNACIMHGFLQYGLSVNYENAPALKSKRAALNIGGKKVTALMIEQSILRHLPNMRDQAQQTADMKDQEETVRSIYGLEHGEPNVAFALCCGTRSSPALRIYTPDHVIAELEKSKLEYLQASIVVTSTRRLMLPSLLYSNMHNFAIDLESLVHWIGSQLPTSWSLRKSMVDCLKGQSNVKINDILKVIPYDYEFQYLLPM